MAEYQSSKLVYILFLTFFTNELVASYQHRSESSYQTYQLGERVCTDQNKKNDPIKLSGDKNNAIVVISPFELLKLDRKCIWSIKAARGDHLFAVIQKMNLRRNSTHCLDYILFKRKDKQGGRKFCGQLDRRSGTTKNALAHYDGEVLSETYALEDFSEFDVSGEIETILYVDNQREFDDFFLTIVYTPYKDCNKIRENRGEYVSEQVKKVLPTNYSICIGKEYVCDGYQNCVSQICHDEHNCTIVGNGTGTKVTIGAVTTIILCFIIFIMGMWICRKNKKLCWSSDCAGPSAHDNRFARAERDVANSVNPSVAVAPMLEVPVISPVLNKDLPPSYDSLFSDPPNPTVT